MTPRGTILLLLPSAFFLLALALVLWPVLVAALEIFKAIRRPVTQPRTFVFFKNGATIWSTGSRSATSKSLSVGDERLRLSVLLVCAIEAAFIVFLTRVFISARPSAVGFAFMLIFCRSPSPPNLGPADLDRLGSTDGQARSLFRPKRSAGSRTHQVTQRAIN